MRRHCDSWDLTKAVLFIVAITAIASTLIVASIRGRESGPREQGLRTSVLVVAPATMDRAISLEEGRR